MYERASAEELLSGGLLCPAELEVGFELVVGGHAIVVYCVRVTNTVVKRCPLPLLPDAVEPCELDHQPFGMITIGIDAPHTAAGAKATPLRVPGDSNKARLFGIAEATTVCEYQTCFLEPDTTVARRED